MSLSESPSPAGSDGITALKFEITREMLGRKMFFLPSYNAASGGEVIFHWVEFGPAK